MRDHRAVPILELVTGVGLVLFWTTFFTLPNVPETAPECYLAYESAFPLPDAILAAALITAAILRLKERPSGVSLSIAAGGALAFLGILDLSFNTQNGFFLPDLFEFLLNVLINLWSVGFGTTLVLQGTLRQTARS